MAALDMGPRYAFTLEKVNEMVTKTSPGNYALGFLNDERTFIVSYVGRADGDVANRIKAHIGEPYTHFKFSYASSPREAFLKECRNYHDFGGCGCLDNQIHPDKPDGANWKCPVCGV